MKNKQSIPLDETDRTTRREDVCFAKVMTIIGLQKSLGLLPLNNLDVNSIVLRYKKHLSIFVMDNFLETLELISFRKITNTEIVKKIKNLPK